MDTQPPGLLSTGICTRLTPAQIDQLTDPRPIHIFITADGSELLRVMLSSRRLPGRHCGV
jgi:hypothetical protein